MSITIVGLGPGRRELLTVEALELLEQAPEIWLRTARHPTVASLRSKATLHSFDELYDRAESFDQLYREIAEQILSLGQRPEGVIYAVPGHPLVAEATVAEILGQARERGIPTHIVSGMSYLEPVIEQLGIDPVASHLQISDALSPNIDPARPALLAQVYSRRVASQVKVELSERYPDEHPVRLVRGAGTEQVEVLDCRLYEIDRSDFADHLTVLYLPAVDWRQNLRSADTYAWIVGRLRRECPWDRKQTHESLKPYLLEEAYEALDALDEGDPAKVAEELGDLLLQVYLHAAIASETGDYDIRDIYEQAGAKLVRRHPHVFGDVSVSGADEVVANWDQLKRKERPAGASALSGVPSALPALAQAQKIQDRAKRAGFDWVSADGALDKVAEEAGEVVRALSQDERRNEFGDLLFSLVGVARHLDVDAEEALRLATRRFKARFQAIERLANGRPLTELSRDELRELWQEAKRQTAGLPN